MCERELETEQNCSILTPTLLAITAFLSRSPGLLNRGPRGPVSLGAGFLYRILSPTATAQSGAWGPTLLGAGFLYRILSLTHLITNSSDLQLPDFLSSPVLYNCFTSMQSLPITGQRNMQILPPLEWHIWSSSSGNDCHAVHSSSSPGASVCDCTVGF